MDLPVIMILGDGRTSLVMKGIAHGAYNYLIKPIRTEELKNIWQHAVRNQRNVGKECERSGSLEDYDRHKHGIDEAEYASSVNKRADGASETSENRKDTKEEDDAEIQYDPFASKKPRVVWSVERHQLFVSAVNQQGINKAVPSTILQLMNVPGLTREEVAQHLQKYKIYLKRLSSVSQQHRQQQELQQKQSTFPEPNCSINVQPSCFVVPSYSSANFQAGNSVASVNQSCSLAGTQSNISPLSTVRVGDGELKPTGMLSGLSGAGSISSTLSSGSVSADNGVGMQVQNAASGFGPSGQLPVLVSNTSVVQGTYNATSKPMFDHGMPKSTDLLGKWKSIARRFAVDEIGLPISNVNQEKMNGENNGNLWFHKKTFVSWRSSICLHNCFLCIFLVFLFFIYIDAFPSSSTF